MCVCVCAVCACVCGGENKRGRKESMGEQDVVTETGGDLSVSSKHRTAGHTLTLSMDSQTIVCLIFCVCYVHFLGSVIRGVPLLNTIDHSILVFRVVEWYSVSNYVTYS